MPPVSVTLGSFIHYFIRLLLLKHSCESILVLQLVDMERYTFLRDFIKALYFWSSLDVQCNLIATTAVT